MKRFLCIGATPSVFRHSFQVSCATVNIHCDFYVSYNWKNGVHRSAWSLKFAVTDGNRGVMWQSKCLFPIFLLARSHVELRNMGCPLVSFLHSNTRCFWSTSQSNKVWVSVSCIAVLLMGFIPILDSYQKNRTLIPVMNVMSVKFLDANPPKMSSVMNMSSFIFYVLRLWGRLLWVGFRGCCWAYYDKQGLTADQKDTIIFWMSSSNRSCTNSCAHILYDVWNICLHLLQGSFDRNVA
jgi:hypothetical protein